MRSPRAAVLACAAALALSACAGRSIRKLDSDRSAAIVGNLKVPGGYRYLHLARVGPNLFPKKGFLDAKGNFMFENLEPGRWYLVNASDGRRIFTLTGSKDDLAWSSAEVKPGQVAYLGSFVVQDIKERVIRKSTFEIKRVAAPDEKTVLRELLPSAAGTGWDKRLEARLKKL